MPTNMPPSAKASGGSKAAIGLVSLAVGLIAGYGAGRVSTGTPVNPLSSKSGSYQEGYDAARQKLEASGVLPPTPAETRTVAGEVRAVGKDSLTLAVNLNSNPLEEAQTPKERTVMVASSTAIYKQVQKTPEEFQKDMQAFQEAQAKGTAPTPPDPFKRVELKFSDIEVGMTVVAVADHDIFSAASFTAIEIIVQESAPAPAPAPEPPPAQ